MLLGEWIVYPNVSLSTFYTGLRGALISAQVSTTTVESPASVQPVDPTM
jgi:hypothetical protein